MSRQLLIRNLNSQVGAQVIVNIILPLMIFGGEFWHTLLFVYYERFLFTPHFIHRLVEYFGRDMRTNLKVKTDTYFICIKLLKQSVVISLSSSQTITL